MRNKLGLLVRIFTLPPIITGLTMLLLWLCAKKLTLYEMLACECCLVFVPALAYPVQALFHIGKDQRSGQRAAAMVFSAVGYVGGMSWAILAHFGSLAKIVFASYLFSIIILLLCNKLLHFKASGHACSATAPAILLPVYLHPLTCIPCLGIIAAVYRSSLLLKRHTLPQLLVGSSISAVAVLVSMLIF